MDVCPGLCWLVSFLLAPGSRRTARFQTLTLCRSGFLRWTAQAQCVDDEGHARQEAPRVGPTFLAASSCSSLPKRHADVDREAMPSNIIYVGVPGFTAFTLLNVGQSALTVLEGNNFLSGLSQGTPPNAAIVAQVAVIFSVIFSLMLIGMACESTSLSRASTLTLS